MQVERRRTRKSPAERKDEILAAAERVFGEKGVDATTIEDITAAAGVAKGTFYLYFDSKDHVIAALRDQFVEETLEYAAELASRVGTDDWWALVDSVVEANIDFALEHRGAAQIFFGETATPETKEIHAQCEARLNEMFVAGIRAGVDAGAFGSPDPEMTAAFLHHAIEGAIKGPVLFGEAVDRDRLVENAKALARKVLAP